MKKQKNNRYKRLLKNILLLFTGNFVSKVLSFFMVPFYTAILTTSDYGIADLITTTVLLVLPFFSVLMDEAVMRFTLDEDSNKQQVFTIAFVVSGIGFIFALCISPVIFLFENIKDYYIFIVLYYVVSWIYNITINYVRGLDRLALTTAAGLIQTFLYLSFNIIFLAVLKIGVCGYLLAMNLSNLGAIIFLIVVCKLHKNFVPLKMVDWKMAKEMIKYSLPMIPNYISWWFNNCLDRYMVSFFCGTAVTGIYSVAYKIPTILSSMTSIFSSAWRISSVEKFGSDESVKFYNRTFRFYSGLLIIGGSVLILFTKFLATILFSKHFFEAWKITPFLILAYTLSALAQFVESIFNASKKTRTLFWASMTGAITNIVLNFILIPKFKGTGAAIATVVGYAMIWIIDMINTSKLFKMNFNLIRLVPGYIILIIEICAVLWNCMLGWIIASACVMIICALNIKEFIQILHMLLAKTKKEADKVRSSLNSKYKIKDNYTIIKDIPCDLKYGDYKNVPIPKMSVVIPTFGRPELLKETILSAANQENIDFQYEIIIVDNEATEYENNTEKMIRELNASNVFYYKNRINVKALGNWNRCMLVARADWIVMCHDDDLMKSDCLNIMNQIIREHQKDKKPIGYVRSSAEAIFSEKLNAVQRKERKKLSKKKTALIKYNYWDVICGGGATWAGAPTCGTLINRKAIIELGGYNPELSPCADCYIPYFMLDKYGVYRTYYDFGQYRWGENDTYKKSTLIGLIKAYYEFLEILSEKYFIVNFFKNEHYIDCVHYYRSKGLEANVVISEKEINEIHPMNYSKNKLKMLYLIRKINSGIKTIFTK